MPLFDGLVETTVGDESEVKTSYGNVDQVCYECCNIYVVNIAVRENDGWV
jgi:hypothetical protein